MGAIGKLFCRDMAPFRATNLLGAYRRCVRERYRCGQLRHSLLYSRARPAPDGGFEDRSDLGLPKVEDRNTEADSRAPQPNSIGHSAHRRCLRRHVPFHSYRSPNACLPGAAGHGQAFVQLEDVVSAIRLAVDRRSQLPRQLVVLIGEPETLSYDEIQHTPGNLIHGEEWETHEIPKSVARAGAGIEDQVPGRETFIKPWMVARADDHYELDISKARTVLGWSPRHNLRDGLSQMVKFLKADPRRWYRENKLEPPADLMPRTEGSAELSAR